MALTPEQARRVIELTLKRRMQGFPALVPAKLTDDPVQEFIQDSANALHEGEAREGAGEGMDQVDHEAVSQTNLSIPMVKEALRNRGVSEDAISAMSRDQLRAEQASMRARSEPTPEQNETVDEDKPLKDNDASRNLHAKELWLSPSFAAFRRRQRYRYMGAALIGGSTPFSRTVELRP